MATCPDCRRRDHVYLGRTGRLVRVPGLVGGSQMKAAVASEVVLTCDEEVGGCGWQVFGYVDGDHVVALGT